MDVFSLSMLLARQAKLDRHRGLRQTGGTRPRRDMKAEDAQSSVPRVPLPSPSDPASGRSPGIYHYSLGIIATNRVEIPATAPDFHPRATSGILIVETGDKHNAQHGRESGGYRRGGSVGPAGGTIWGNGKAAAVLLARQGASVFLLDINREAMAETGGIIEAEGGVCATHRCDMMNATEVGDRCGPVWTGSGGSTSW